MSIKNHDIIGSDTLAIIASADKFNEWMYQTIKPYLVSDILEIGSGIGNISKFVINDKYRISLSDYNLAYQEHLIQTFGQLDNVSAIYNIDLQRKDFKKAYSHLEGKFNCIFLLNVIEHLGDDTLAVDFCHFLLKKEGNLITLAPSYQWLFCNLDKNLGHYRRYTIKTLSKTFSSDNFIIKKKFYFNAVGVLGWFFSGKILRQQKLKKKEFKLFNKLVPVFKLADKILNKSIGLSTVVIGQKK